MPAAIGNVTTQDIKMLRKILQSNELAPAPTPEIEPTDTWVVETGKPSVLALSTRVAVIRLAATPGDSSACPIPRPWRSP